MNALRGGFKRFDDRTDDNQKNRGKHSHKSSRKVFARRDQSVLPILNFEDSNGLSPVYSGATTGARWEAIDFAPKTTTTGNQNNTVPINDSSFRTLRSIDNGKGEEQPRNIRKNLGRFGENESANQPLHTKPERKHIHRKQQQHTVFDPFCMDDNMEDGQQNFANFVSTTSGWDAFSNENVHEDNGPEDNDIFQGGNPFQRTVSESPSMNLSKPTTTTDFTSFGNFENAYYEEEDHKENSFEQNFSENEDDTEILHETNDGEVQLSEDRQKQRRSSMSTRRSSRNITRKTTDEQELLSCCDIETTSLSSFPERVKPIEFLKKERLVDDQIKSSDEIFINFDEVSCHSVEADQSKSDDTTSGSDIGIDTEIRAADSVIEVVDLESVVSRELTVEKEDTQQPDMSKCDDSLEDAHSRRDELLSPMFGNNDYRTPREQSSPTKRMSTASKKLDIENTTMKEEGEETQDHSSTKTEDSHIEKKAERDQLNALQKFVKLAAPVLSSGAISLAKDDPIRLAAEKLGISLNDNTTEPEEHLVKVPLNVEIKHKKSQIAGTQEIISKEHSIHFKTNTKNRQRQGSSMMSPSSSSLLDCDETDISDLHTLSQSVDDSFVDPRKYVQSIDLKSVHSGSISAITFRGGNGSIDPDGYSESRSADSYKKVEKYQRERRIPRGSTRRREYDMSTTMEKPDPPRVGSSVSEKEKRHRQKGKPLGASMEEIEMINKFLAIVGSNFDGSSLSIEERENLHHEAAKAGLSEDFLNKMLDQSAGIILWEQRSVSSDDYSETSKIPTPLISKARIETPGGSTFTGRSFRTKGSADDMTKATLETGYSEDFTYDEDGFTMKTPKETKFSCLRNLFWMESSNVVGDDMTENILAVMSADSESIYSRRRKSKR